MIWLRRTHPDIPRGYRVPLYPVLPALGIVSCFALIFTVENRVLIFFAWYIVARDRALLRLRHAQFGARQGPSVVADDGELPLFPEDAPLDADGKPIVRP